jgi:hypothetical protein
MILGDPWLYDVRGRYSARKGYLDIYTKTREQTRCWNRANHIIRPTNIKALRIVQATALSINHLVRSATTSNRLRISRVLLEDIEKALQLKKHINPKDKLPKRYWRWLDVFSQQLADKIPPHQPGIDHKILLKRDQNSIKESPPYGPLYGMNREELLYLRKTLTDLLGKNFIRVS